MASVPRGEAAIRAVAMKEDKESLYGAVYKVAGPCTCRAVFRFLRRRSVVCCLCAHSFLTRICVRVCCDERGQWLSPTKCLAPSCTNWCVAPRPMPPHASGGITLTCAVVSVVMVAGCSRYEWAVTSWWAKSSSWRATPRPSSATKIHVRPPPPRRPPRRPPPRPCPCFLQPAAARFCVPDQ